MAIDYGAIGSIGSSFLGDLATIREGGAVAGQAKANAANAYRAADFTRRMGALDVVRQTRAASRQLGSIVADASGSGLTQGGSAIDILRSSAQEAALDVGLTRMGTQQATQTFLDRAAGYEAEAKAAKKKKKGGILGAIGGILGGAAGFILGGGPAGAAAGYSIGSGAGSFIGSL